MIPVNFQAFIARLFCGVIAIKLRMGYNKSSRLFRKEGALMQTGPKRPKAPIWRICLYCLLALVFLMLLGYLTS